MSDTETPAADTTNGGAPPASTATPSPAGGTPAPSPWGELSPEDKGLVGLKGWKGPGDVVAAYRNLESFRGVPADRLIKIPEKPDDPEWAKVWGQLGRPEKPDGYELTSPEGDEAGAALVKLSAETFHRYGVPREAGRAIVAEIARFAGERQKATEEAAVLRRADDEGQLRKNWGDAYDANRQVAGDAARKLGLQEADVVGLMGTLGIRRTYELFHQIGMRSAEPRTVRPEGGGGGEPRWSPEMAREKISQLKQDKEWVKRYLDNDQKALDEMSRLHRIAFP